MTPAARGLAAEIAKLLGRPENEGWVFTRCFQDADIFKIGARGGCNGSKAPRATTMHGVLLFLAMATGAPPREAVADAVQFGMLPFLEMRRYDMRPDGESFAVEQPPGAVPQSFAGCVGEIINWHRLGHSPDGVPVAIRFGVNCGIQFAELLFNAAPTEADKGTPLIVVRYGAQLEGVAANTYPIYRFAEINGAILRDIAKLLGALSSSGGGIALSEDTDEDADDAESETSANEDLPLAAQQSNEGAP